MTTINLDYGTEVEHAITLASLANNGARGGDSIDNSSDQNIDAQLGGVIRTGAVAPTADSPINIYVVGSNDDVLWDDNYSGSDADHTLGGNAKLVHTIRVDTTTGKDYEFGGISVAQAFGGVLPRYWAVIVENLTGQTLDTTGSNFEINHVPVNFQQN